MKPVRHVETLSLVNLDARNKVHEILEFLQALVEGFVEGLSLTFTHRSASMIEFAFNQRQFPLDLLQQHDGTLDQLQASGVFIFCLSVHGHQGFLKLGSFLVNL